MEARIILKSDSGDGKVRRTKIDEYTPVSQNGYWTTNENSNELIFREAPNAITFLEFDHPFTNEKITVKFIDCHVLYKCENLFTVVEEGEDDVVGSYEITEAIDYIITFEQENGYVINPDN
jgi:hypothetical protein